jgi:hypothetical protein
MDRRFELVGVQRRPKKLQQLNCRKIVSWHLTSISVDNVEIIGIHDFL